ncbi:MAG: transposase [Candidatus Sulfotelmatobacter sp.]
MSDGVAALGPEVVAGLRFVCSDLWKPYLDVSAEQASQALHVLDRFHITMHLNQAVDQVRRGESRRLRAAGRKERLRHMRWTLLRRGSRVRGQARRKLQALLSSKLATARARELKESLRHLWTYKSLLWARTFLDYWCWRAMRSRLEPMQKVARMLRAHEELLMNWFRAKGEISNGAVEGLNNKIQVVTRSLMVSAPIKRWKSRYITRLADFQSRHGPTDFADEASLRVIIGAAIFGYVPIFGAELLRRPFGINGDELAGFGLGWGFWITIPCTLVGILFLLYEVVHLITGWGE